MKTLYLASFLEPENFGPGRVIGIANGQKPLHIDVQVVFKHLVPPSDLIKRYRNISLKGEKKEASKMFVKEYSMMLNKFEKDVKEDAKKQGKEPVDILPFEDGDTLASWEREKFTNYRKLISPVLKRLGFNVILK